MKSSLRSQTLRRLFVFHFFPSYNSIDFNKQPLETFEIRLIEGKTFLS